MLGSCSSDDKKVDTVQATVERGAVLRTLSLSGGALDVLDTSATTTIELEEQDHQDGALLSEVRVFVDLDDNTDDETTTTSEAFVKAIPSSDFIVGEFGLPRTTLSITLGEMVTALGLDFGDYNCGDAFLLRLELELTDGRVFSSDDVTGTVQGGSFFSSPFQYRVNLIAPLPSEDLYTGQYQLTSITPGIFGVNDFVDGEYTIESTGNTIRVIKDALTFPAFGPFGPVDIEFQFICGEIVMSSAQGMGAGCGATIQNGPALVDNSTYDLANPDDTDFIINFTSDEVDDCGTGGAQGSIRLTKI